MGALSLAVELLRSNELKEQKDAEKLKSTIEAKLRHLLTSRPTAVNLQRAVEDIKGRLYYRLGECRTVYSELLQLSTRYFLLSIYLRWEEFHFRITD